MITALGIDTGLANLGVALVELRSPTDFTVLEMRHVSTAASDKKAKVLTADDDSRRVYEVVRALDPLFARADFVTAEAISYVRNARTMAQIGRAWGAVDALVETYQFPFVQSSPQAIKKALTGVNSASKEEVQAALDKLAGYCLGEKHLRATRKTAWEHPYDALGSILAARSSDVVRALFAGGKRG